MDYPLRKFKSHLPMKHECILAEQRYNKNPRDAENLTRWGVALLRLSQAHSFPDSLHTIQGISYMLFYS